MRLLAPVRIIIISKRAVPVLRADRALMKSLSCVLTAVPDKHTDLVHNPLCGNQR